MREAIRPKLVTGMIHLPKDALLDLGRSEQCDSPFERPFPHPYFPFSKNKRFPAAYVTA